MIIDLQGSTFLAEEGKTLQSPTVWGRFAPPLDERTCVIVKPPKTNFAKKKKKFGVCEGFSTTLSHKKKQN